MSKTIGTDATPLLGDQLCFAVYSTAHAFNRLYRQQLDAIGLTYPQYLVLLVLWERDGLMVKELGERLHLDSGTLTPLLKRLEANGLIDRKRDPADERQVRVALTRDGVALREKAAAIQQEVFAASGCSSAELAALRGALLVLRDNLNAASRLFP